MVGLKVNPDRLYLWPLKTETIEAGWFEDTLTMSSFRIVVIARSVFCDDREAYPKGKQSPRKPGDCFALLAVTKCVEFIEQEFNLTLSKYSLSRNDLDKFFFSHYNVFGIIQQE